MSNQQTYWRLVWRQFQRNRLAMAGLFLVVLLFIVAVLAPILANDKPLVLKKNGKIYFPFLFQYSELSEINLQDLKRSLADDDFLIPPLIPYSPTQYDLDARLIGPDARHWLGTDDRGRDVLSRMIYGARISLSVGFVAVGIYIVIGVIFGALAGYYGGTVDWIVSRLIEIWICFPAFFLILTVLAYLRPSIYNIMVVIGLTGWPGVARLVRGEFLKLRNQDFVAASQAIGSPAKRIIFRHVLPNALAPVLVSASFGVAAAILVESSLSFLGFGVPPPTPSWGDILSQSMDYIDFAWWLTIFPGTAIFITVTAYNLFGDGLRDALDPRLRI